MKVKDMLVWLLVKERALTEIGDDKKWHLNEYTIKSTNFLTSKTGTEKKEKTINKKQTGDTAARPSQCVCF